MMEDIKAKCKDYVWKYGMSPYKEDEERRIQTEEVNPLCAFYGCTLKAMALTRFCHLHILSDLKQVMYKPCEYVIKRFLFLFFLRFRTSFDLCFLMSLVFGLLICFMEMEKMIL